METRRPLLRRLATALAALSLLVGCSALGTGGDPDTVQAAQAFLSAFNGPYAAGDVEALAQRFAEGVQRKSPSGRQHGRDAVRAHYARMLERFRDPSFTSLRLVVQGDTAVCECRGMLTERASGKRIDLQLAIVLTFDASGQVARFDEYYDTAEFRRQLQ